RQQRDHGLSGAALRARQSVVAGGAGCRRAGAALALDRGRRSDARLCGRARDQTFQRADGPRAGGADRRTPAALHATASLRPRVSRRRPSAARGSRLLFLRGARAGRRRLARALSGGARVARPRRGPAAVRTATGEPDPAWVTLVHTHLVIARESGR